MWVNHKLIVDYFQCLEWLICFNILTSYSFLWILFSILLVFVFHIWNDRLAWWLEHFFLFFNVIKCLSSLKMAQKNFNGTDYEISLLILALCDNHVLKVFAFSGKLNLQRRGLKMKFPDCCAELNSGKIYVTLELK